MYILRKCNILNKNKTATPRILFICFHIIYYYFQFSSGSGKLSNKL